MRGKSVLTNWCWYVEKVEFLIIFEILTRLGIVKRSFTCSWTQGISTSRSLGTGCLVASPTFRWEKMNWVSVYTWCGLSLFPMWGSTTTSMTSSCDVTSPGRGMTTASRSSGSNMGFSLPVVCRCQSGLVRKWNILSTFSQWQRVSWKQAKQHLTVSLFQWNSKSDVRNNRL